MDKLRAVGKKPKSQDQLEREYLEQRLAALETAEKARNPKFKPPEPPVELKKPN